MPKFIVDHWKSNSLNFKEFYQIFAEKLEIFSIHQKMFLDTHESVKNFANLEHEQEAGELIEILEFPSEEVLNLFLQDPNNRFSVVNNFKNLPEVISFYADNSINHTISIVDDLPLVKPPLVGQ